MRLSGDSLTDGLVSAIPFNPEVADIAKGPSSSRGQDASGLPDGRSKGNIREDWMDGEVGCGGSNKLGGGEDTSCFGGGSDDFVLVMACDAKKPRIRDRRC